MFGLFFKSYNVRYQCFIAPCGFRDKLIFFFRASCDRSGLPLLLSASHYADFMYKNSKNEKNT